MARIRTKFHNKQKSQSVETIAGVMGMNIWKLASGSANKMYNSGFNFKSNSQLIDVIGEFVIFLLQLADRMAYAQLSAEGRGRFTQALASHLIQTMVENQLEELGPGDYRGAFVDKLNQRLDGYAELEVVDGNPGYQMLRYFAANVDAVMGGGDNKWVLETVLEVEAPAVVKPLREGMTKLLPQIPGALDSDHAE
ncbi:MAG: hypothetical protein OQL08_08700 [Gammaproteobacteria bacterium]|nr:hypothetical protein [Gammaproteobacteria bacterium]